MEDVRPEYKKKSIRSYVVRSGRMTDGQKLGFHDHWPNYGLSLHQGLLNFQSEFGRNAPRNWVWYGRIVAQHDST